jgi:hypothetical protein
MKNKKMKNKKMYRIVILFSLILFSCSGSIDSTGSEKLTGKEIISLLGTLELSERENKIFDLIANKNIPSFLEKLSEIKVTHMVENNNYELLYYVTPDYYSLGIDKDYFLIPMTPILAQKVANYYGAILPTKKIVDHIYEQSVIKYFPQPIPPSVAMVTIEVFAAHNDSVIQQRKERFNSYNLSALASGHKKDVIISNNIYNNLKPTVPKPIVIYGWHKLDGKPIQPVYNGHGNNYTDYSHGIRLVKNKCKLNGKDFLLTDILKDSLLSILISDEGPILKPEY